MKNLALYLLCLSLCACGGGSGGNSTTGIPGPQGPQGIQGVPGKSAYQIWLDAGNTGTEQDFLDSLVSHTANNGTDNSGDNSTDQPPHYVNFKEYFDNNRWAYIYDYVENTQNWQNHNNYKHYEWKGHSFDWLNGASHTLAWHFFDEKELQLANYGVRNSINQREFQDNFVDTSNISATGYIHNREGVGTNLYTPQENTIFYGGTLAYLDSISPQEDVFLKGNATFKYNSTNPELLLEFDNYYTFNIVKGISNSETTTVSGTNNTSNAFYDISTGTYAGDSSDAKFSSAHLQKESIQEAVGTYSLYFGSGAIGGNTTNHFYLHGAFGGTKQ